MNDIIEKTEEFLTGRQGGVVNQVAQLLLLIGKTAQFEEIKKLLTVGLAVLREHAGKIPVAEDVAQGGIGISL